MIFFQGDFILCLTPTGEIRWKVFLESVAGMYPIALSNIVVDRQGTLYYTVGWSGDQVFTAKACQISQANTTRPVQKCIQNYNLISASGAPLALNEKYGQLITAVDDNKFESVPAVVNKTDLSLFWINRHVFGARSNQNYRCDFQSGDIFWFGGDDRFVKFDYSGQKLIENFTVNSLVGRDFVLNHEQQIIVVPWQDATHLPWKLLVSSFDVSNRNIKLRWTWHALSQIANNDDVTPPTMDSNGTVFMSSMPLAFAIDHIGKLKWTSELATSSEMKQYNLIAYCIAMNSNRRVLYILSGSSRIQKSNSLFFISVVNMDSGKILKRIELDVAKNQLVLPQCPILIGNEIFYFAWLTGEYPNLVPFHVTAFAQL